MPVKANNLGFFFIFFCSDSANFFFFTGLMAGVFGKSFYSFGCYNNQLLEGTHDNEGACICQ